jgi:uncharacterized coiled-coil protein SlyX
MPPLRIKHIDISKMTGPEYYPSPLTPLPELQRSLQDLNTQMATLRKNPHTQQDECDLQDRIEAVEEKISFQYKMIVSSNTVKNKRFFLVKNPSETLRNLEKSRGELLKQYDILRSVGHSREEETDFINRIVSLEGDIERRMKLECQSATTGGGDDPPPPYKP